jgi:hypothetical protein
MVSEIQSLEFLKESYPKERAAGWLKTNHFPEAESKLHSDGKYWVYDIRPKKDFRPKSFTKRPAGNMSFVYGIMNMRLGKIRGKKKVVEKRRNPLGDALRHKTKEDINREYENQYRKERFSNPDAVYQLPKELEVAGSGVQSVRVPKNWGLEKARHWVDNKGWTPDYHSKSPFTETDKWYRFRQTAPHKDSNYRIKKLPNKVQLVMEY